MRKFLFILMVVIPFVGFTQVQNPVSWSFSATKTADMTYEIHLTATIGKGWHIYSQTTPDGGPVATSVTFSKNPLLIVSGAVKEIGRLEEHNEPIFGVDVKQYSDKVDFVQVVKVKANAKTAINGSIDFMVCNNKQCLPPKTMEFSVSLK